MENRTKNIDIITILGITANVLAVIFAGYIFYTTIPKAQDVKTKPEVLIPQIDNPTLESAIGELDRPEELPINIDPNDLGKSNPYNF